MIVVCVSPSVIPRKFVITCQIDFRRSVRVREEGREGGDEPYCEEGERDSVALDDHTNLCARKIIIPNCVLETYLMMLYVSNSF